jgi:hypothetical protein
LGSLELAIGLIASLLDGIPPDGFGMPAPPRVGAKPRVVGLTGEQPLEDILEIGPDVEVIGRKKVSGTEKVFVHKRFLTGSVENLPT